MHCHRERDQGVAGVPPFRGMAIAFLFGWALASSGCDQQDAWACCVRDDGSGCRCDVRAHDDTACAADSTPTDTCNTDVVADGLSVPYCCLDEESCRCHQQEDAACLDGTFGNVPACPGSAPPELCSPEVIECEKTDDCSCGQECLETGDEAMPMACAYPCKDDDECALISEALTVPQPKCVELGTVLVCE